MILLIQVNRQSVLLSSRCTPKLLAVYSLVPIHAVHPKNSGNTGMLFLFAGISCFDPSSAYGQVPPIFTIQPIISQTDKLAASFGNDAKIQRAMRRMSQRNHHQVRKPSAALCTSVYSCSYLADGFDSFSRCFAGHATHCLCTSSQPPVSRPGASQPQPGCPQVWQM